MRNKGLIIAWVTAGIALVAGLWVLSRFIFPPPPDRVTMATGNAQGTYHAAAVRYQRLLQEDDIQLDLVQTAGAVENLQMLQAGEVDLAFLQGGLTPTDTDALMGLCSAFLEPLWIFTLEDADIHDLRDLQARRVTIGPPGSGTRVLATRLLTAVGASEDVTTWQEQTLTAKALHDKVSDAGLIVSSLKSERVRTLLRTPGLRPISLRRRDAYAQRYPYLEAIELPEGVIDLKENLPGQTIQGVAAAASIVARKDLHPGVITVFLMAVQRTHEKGDLFSPPGTFPSPDFVEVPLSEDARQFLEEGPSLLYRFLPLRIAGWISRLFVLMLPLLTLLIPLSRIAPPLYHWRMRSKIYQWYELLREIDTQLDKGTVKPEDALRQLSELELSLHERVDVPLSYMEEFYELRSHIELIQNKARKISGNA